MKTAYFILGIVLGGLAMYIMYPRIGRNYFTVPTQQLNHDTTHSDWKWPDSYQALIAAPLNHELVFETDQFRLLKVTVVPGVLDPIHTHEGKSIIWITKTSPILYNVYDYDHAKNLHLVRTDTIDVQKEELFKGAWENPEPPHSVENIGGDTFELYRIEFKSKM